MRFVRIALKSLLMLVLLLGLVLIAAVQFLSSERGRNFAARELGRLLSAETGTQIELELHALTATHLDASARARDQRGRTFGRVEHLTLTLDSWGLVVSWWHGAPLLLVHEIRAEEVELRIDSGLPAPRRSSTPAKTRPRMPGIVIDELAVERLEIVVSKDVELQGSLAGTLSAAHPSELRAKLDFEGELADQPLRLSASLDGGKLQGQARLDGYGASARLAVSGDIATERRVDFDGALDVNDWARVSVLPQAPRSGSLHARTRGTVDLRKLALSARIEADAESLIWQGATVDRVALRGRWQGPLQKLPTAELRVEVDGVRAGPWQGDNALAATGDVELGTKNVRAEVLARDRVGPILRAHAETSLSALTKPQRAALSASLVMPDRLLSSLPLPLPLSDDARLAATAEVRGTIAAPELRLRARLRAKAGIIDVAGTAHPARLSAARSKLEMIQDLRVDIQRFPLKAVPALESAGLTGEVQGALYAEGRDGGQGVARLEASALTLQDKQIPDANASLMLVNGRLAGFVHMGDRERFLQAQLGARLADSDLGSARQSLEAAELKLDARAFPVVAVFPVKGGPIVARGTLDGNLELALGQDVEHSRMGGSLRFSRGVLSIPTFGPALQDVKAELSLQSQGLLELKNVSARGVSGRVHGEGQARLKGLAFDSARFSLRGDGFALWVAGSQIGTVKGQVDFVAERQPSGTMELRYDVNSAELELPGRRGMVRKAREDPTIVVGVVTDDGRRVAFVPEEKRPLGPSKPSLRLGGTLRRVKVTRPGQLEFIVRGDPVLEIGQPFTVRGELQVTEGWLNVLGKRFQVEQGTIRFDGGELRNATVSAFASWTADDGTRVRVGVQGKLAELKTTMQSEPARSEAEIVQLITTGTTEEKVGLEKQDPLATAVGTSAAARIVNDALAGVAPGVQTRVDTTDPLNPQPEFEVQASEKVSVRFTTSLGVTAEGTDRSTTTIDYRAAQRWLVSTKVGNTGSTAVDVIWQFRY
jgi:hypothetical protein